jgi:hypothetical protein
MLLATGYWLLAASRQQPVASSQTPIFITFEHK